MYVSCIPCGDNGRHSLGHSPISDILSPDEGDIGVINELESCTAKQRC